MGDSLPDDRDCNREPVSQKPKNNEQDVKVIRLDFYALIILMLLLVACFFAGVSLIQSLQDDTVSMDYINDVISINGKSIQLIDIPQSVNVEKTNNVLGEFYILEWQSDDAITIVWVDATEYELTSQVHRVPAQCKRERMYVDHIVYVCPETVIDYTNFGGTLKRVKIVTRYFSRAKKPDSYILLEADGLGDDMPLADGTYFASKGYIFVRTYFLGRESWVSVWGIDDAQEVVNVIDISR